MKKFYIILTVIALCGCAINNKVYTPESAPLRVSKEIRPLSDDAETQIQLCIRPTKIKEGITLPFVGRTPPHILLHSMLLEAASRKYIITPTRTKNGITLAVELTDISHMRDTGTIKVSAQVMLKDLKGAHLYAVDAEYDAPAAVEIGYNTLMRKACRGALERLTNKLMVMMGEANARPADPISLDEVRGYVAEIYLNKDTHRIVIDPKTARVYSLSELNNLSVQYILYAIARGNGYKSAIDDIERLKGESTIMEFFDSNHVGIVIINADKTTKTYDSESIRLSERMGGRGALTYVMADNQGKQLWHTFGRLNIPFLRKGLNQPTVEDWTAVMFAELENGDQEESMDWFAPYIDVNAY